MSNAPFANFILALLIYPTSTFALQPTDLPTHHILYNTNPDNRVSLQIKCDSLSNQIEDYLDGSKLRCNFIETKVTKESKDRLNEKINKLFEKINTIKEDEFEMSSYKDICFRRQSESGKVPEQRRKELIDRFCFQKDINLERAVVNLLLDLIYLDHDTCKVSSRSFQLDFVYRETNRRWEAVQPIPMCSTTTVNTLIPDPDNAGLWFFRKTRTVQREPDQDPICLEFVDSDIVYSWKNPSRMDMDCKVIQLTEAF